MLEDRPAGQRRSPRLVRQELDRVRRRRQRADNVLQAMVDLVRANPRVLDWTKFPVPEFPHRYPGRRQYNTSMTLIESRLSYKAWRNRITPAGLEFRDLFHEGADCLGRSVFLHMVHDRFMQEKLRERDDAQAAEDAAFAAALADPNPVVGVDSDSDDDM